MGLKADLTVRIDAGTLVTTFLGQIDGAAGGLTAIVVPAEDSDVNTATSGVQSVDTGSIEQSLLPFLSAITGLIGELPGAEETMRPITTTLELIESLTTADLPNQLQALTDRLSGELTGGEGGVLDALLRMANALNDAPEAGVLRELLRALTGARGVTMPTSGGAATDFIGGLEGAVKALGGLMGLETALSEAERLSAIVAAQLDPGRVEFETGALKVSLEGGTSSSGSSISLPAFIRGLDVDNPAEVQAAVRAVLEAAARQDRLNLQIAEAMGFGEATLVYLDVGQVKVRVDAAAALVRQVDLNPIQRAGQWLAERFSPIVDIDLSAAPAQQLETLLSELESRIGEMADAITAFDPAVITAPLTDVLGKATGALTDLTDLITQITVSVQSALNGVRDAVAALPIDDIANAVHAVLEPITDALTAIGDLVAGIEAALQTAADEAIAILETTEGVVDDFKAQIEALFADAAAFMRTVPIQQTIGQVGDQIKAFVDLVARAQMKPYFDTAVGAIGSAADVIEKVPFSLLPDSMASDVNALIQPIKRVDSHKVETDIEGMLGIDPDGGGFTLRPDLEAAVADIQLKYDHLMEAIRDHNPRIYLQQIDEKLSGLADQIRDLAPQVALDPIQEAIDRVKDAIGGFDLDAVLQPLRDGFDQVLTAMDRYAPGQLIQPIEDRVDEAREQVVTTLGLREWSAKLDTLKEAALSLVDKLNPSGLESRLAAALHEALELLDRFPDQQVGGAFGTLISALFSGLGIDVQPRTFELVLSWFRGTSGTSALSERAGKVADALIATRDAVRRVDPQAIAVQVTPAVQQVKGAIAELPPGSARAQLEKAASRLDPVGLFGALAANREHYLAALDAAVILADALRRTGLSEADVVVARLKVSIDPVRALGEVVRQILQRMGIRGLDQGVPGVMRSLLSVATPERLAGVAGPLFRALRGRVEALLNAVIQPLKDGIDQLLDLVDTLDLTPLRESVDGIYNAVKADVAALSPDALLGDVLTAFNDARADVLDFDPLAAVDAVLTELRDTVARVLDKLKTEEILAAPLSVFDEILAALEALNLQAMLQPVFDQLDVIAAQVDEGLDQTVTAFERLQAALPASVGGGSVSGSASVGFG